jgi:RNA polymerase sigma factor (sigma-70 family)
MASGQLSTVLRHLHELTEAAQAGDLTDPELLERFTARREGAAFAALVKRHGPMVLSVCRRVLGNAHDAEDAFQATFLVLVRRAPSLRREALGGWLHKVALRVALRARASSHSRRRHEQRALDVPREDCLAAVVWRDLQPVLDEEVRGLPESCREAFVLCYLEGKTYEQTARQLRCRPGTVSRRLARARELLRGRLTRRGLALPAGVLAAALSRQAAPAAVPASLITSTLNTVPQAAAGAVPARVAALAEGGLRAMTASKTKVALALLLTAGLVLAAAAALARSAPAAGAAPGQESPAAPQAGAGGPKAAAPQPGAHHNNGSGESAKDLVVSGQVMSSGGKPVAGADVALLGRAWVAARGGRSGGSFTKTLAAGKTDPEGKFRLGATGLSKAAYWEVVLLARAPGHGLMQERLDAKPGGVTVNLSLPGERVLRGRLVDLQGQPAAGVKIRLELANGKLPSGKHAYLYLQRTPDGERYWPGAVVSDAAGRFRLGGLPAGCDLTLNAEGQGAAFARQNVEVTRDGAPEKEVTLALAPGRVLEGTVTYRDTGKPVPDARVRIESWTLQPSGGFRIHGVGARADAKGRYRAVPYDGDTFVVTAHPPDGEPYLLGSQRADKPRGLVLKQEINVSLRRGIRVLGVVKEAVSGKPVAGAFVEFQPRYSNNPFYARDARFARDVTTGADGTFAMVVLPGPGHLLINGPTPDYLHKAILTRDLNGPNVSPNRRYYPDGLVALDLKPEVGTHRVEVTLKRGVPLKGRVLGPDGKAVAGGHLLCRCYVPTGFTLNGPSSVPVKDGRFELPGWDAANPAPLYVLSPELGLGGVLRVKGGQGDKEPTIQLQKCGGAKVRIVDQGGKPLADSRVVVSLPISPGVSFFDKNDFGGKEATADAPSMGSFDRKNFGNLRTDADGRVELRGLIPGARHWLIVTQPGGGPGMVRVPVDLRAEAGKMLDLKDVTVNSR